MRVLAEMTADLRGRGVHSVTLKDQWERVHARYRPGKGLVLEDVARIGERVSHDAPTPPAPATP